MNFAEWLHINYPRASPDSAHASGYKLAFEAGQCFREPEISALKKELRVKQRLVHAGQYHQWNTFEICQQGECVRIKELTAGADKGDGNG